MTLPLWPLLWRFLAVAVVDALVLGLYAVVSGRSDMLATILLQGSLLFCLLLVLAALGLRYRFGSSPHDALSLNRLPRQSGLLVAAVSVLHAGLLFNSGLLAADTTGIRELSAAYVTTGLLWYLLVYATLYGFFVYSLVGDLVARQRLLLWSADGRHLGAGDGSLVQRMVLAFGVTLLLPALLLLFDFTWLAPLRTAQGLNAAEIVILDVVAAFITLSVTLTVMARSVLRATRVLEAGQQELAAGGGSDVPVVSDDEFGRLAESFNRMRLAVREREFLRTAFSTFVGAEVSHRLLSTEQTAASKHEATVMFTDIAGFTSISESKPPEQLVAMLRAYFAVVVAVVERHGGRVDNFVGDAILAVFNLDGRQPDHARRALAAAREISAVTGSRQFAGETLNTRIGVHTGAVAAGDVGSDSRRGFSVFGDTVNVAARLEAENKRFGTVILASDSVLAAAGAQDDFEPCGEAGLRGRQTPISVWGKRSPMSSLMEVPA